MPKTRQPKPDPKVLLAVWTEEAERAAKLILLLVGRTRNAGVALESVDEQLWAPFFRLQQLNTAHHQIVEGHPERALLDAPCLDRALLRRYDAEKARTDL